MPRTVEAGAPKNLTVPEHELLLLCSRTRLEAPALLRLDGILDGAIDWTAVLAYGDIHGTGPLLYHHLREPGRGRIPEAVLEGLRTRSVAAAARSLMLTAELGALFDALEAADAPALVWKGPVLAHSIYPSPELRPFRDLDIIVRREDVDRMRRVLEARGYSPRPGPSEDGKELFREANQDVTMWNPRTGVLVDVHWGAMKRYFSSAMDSDALWTEGQRTDLNGWVVRTLPPTMSLIALSLHGAKHGPFPWPELKWITDVEGFVRAHPTDAWSPLLARARALGCHRAVLLGLLLAKELLDAPLPPEVEADLDRDNVVATLIPAIRDRLLSLHPAPFPLGERLQFDLAVRERLRDRLRYRAARLLTPGRRDVGGLPTPLGFLRVPLRLSRLAGRYLLRPSRLRDLFEGRGTPPD